MRDEKTRNAARQSSTKHFFLTEDPILFCLAASMLAAALAASGGKALDELIAQSCKRLSATQQALQSIVWQHSLT